MPAIGILAVNGHLMKLSAHSIRDAFMSIALRPRHTPFVLLGVLSLAATGALNAQSSNARQQSGPPANVFIQLYEGVHFNDTSYALNTSDERIRTLLLNGDGRWRYGEHTFYARIFMGDFVDGAGASLAMHARTYAELTSRLSFLAMGSTDRREQGRLRDLFLAVQVNRGGTGFRANLIGAGLKLRWPGELRTTTSVYYRQAPGDDPGIKARTSWYLPLTTGRVALSFEGSEDLVTGTATGIDQNGMPSLLADVGKLLGGTPGVFSAGLELFHHQTKGTRLSAPQLTVRWSF